ncbi:hypothetical protein SELMODRAFT_163076 [Selaginella moellendorffii]|uniref:J domain-containing protein n=1 Tax=Selaginella moellendorffii TaxID=88036 RepID=D8TDA6_SELML|nr:NAD(P)H-quinone oxidoreductase subunit T, chloroplastic [Selaginella moellendorffii]EFJ05357.1 hypothetical protein SELMODRAFT_163076 [Selaginella moellendorffii]|eukprot:XP_002993582.1 NAD(P)H-quinone oxidoreductase subunit T, chloroplastic [Selaginella moellendorffii]
MLLSRSSSSCHGRPRPQLKVGSSSPIKCSAVPNAPNKRANRMIEWSSPDEGWIRFDKDDDPDKEGQGGGRAAAEAAAATQEGKDDQAGLDDTITDLIAHVSGTHYEFLGITPEADTEEIKVAYRKLSKQYHPDSTTLPLEVAGKKFLRLKEAYNVLSSEDDRKLYDWHLAQEASKARGGRFIWPYEVDRSQRRESSKPPKWKTEWQPKLDPIEVLDGKNLKLSDQQQTALAFDLFAILVSVATMIYVGFFKH